MDIDSVVKSYDGGPNRIQKILENISEDVMKYIPFDGAWSIHEHVIHLVESDINNFIRWRSILGQPGSEVFVIRDEMDWGEKVGYLDEDREPYLELFALIRSIGSRYLQTLSREKWSQHTFIHKYQGQENHWNLYQAIQVYSQHVDDHIEYITRNLRLWSEKYE